MDIRPVVNASQSRPAASETADTAPASATPKATISSAEPVSLVQQPEAVPNEAQVAEALKSINKAMQAMSRSLEFAVDPDSNRTIIKVIDQQSGEVIRQLPTEEALEIAKALDKAQGLLIRQRA